MICRVWEFYLKKEDCWNSLKTRFLKGHHRRLDHDTLKCFPTQKWTRSRSESANLLIKIRVQAQHRPEDTCLDMAPPTMLSPQLNGLEPLYVLPGEEHEADCGHPLVHLTQENHIKNYHTPTKLSKIKTNNDSPL